MKRGYTIKQRFTSVLLVALIPFMLLLIGVQAVAAALAESSLPTVRLVTKIARIVEWYGELLETLRYKK